MLGRRRRAWLVRCTRLHLCTPALPRRHEAGTRLDRGSGSSGKGKSSSGTRRPAGSRIALPPKTDPTPAGRRARGDRSLGAIHAGPVTQWDLATGRLAAHRDLRRPGSPRADHVPAVKVLSRRWDAGSLTTCMTDASTTSRPAASSWITPNDGRIGVFMPTTAASRCSSTARSRRSTPRPAKRSACPDRRIAPRWPERPLRSTRTAPGVIFTDRWVLADGVDGRHLALDGSLDGMADSCLSGDNRFLAVALVNRPRGVVDAMLTIRSTPARRVRSLRRGHGRGRRPTHSRRSYVLLRPDGRTLAVAHTDKSIALWDWPPPSRWPRTSSPPRQRRCSPTASASGRVGAVPGKAIAK